MTILSYQTFKISIGHNRKFGSAVTTDEMKDFIETNVVPYFDGFTVSLSIGYWEGKRELTTVIEISLPVEKAHSEVFAIATNARDLFGQEAVMLRTFKSEVAFI